VENQKPIGPMTAAIQSAYVHVWNACLLLLLVPDHHDQLPIRPRHPNRRGLFHRPALLHDLGDQVALKKFIGYRSSNAIQELLSHLCIFMQKLDEFFLYFLSLTSPFVCAFGR